jgi:hypothetical protein
MDSMNRVVGFKASACSSVQIPRQRGVIRPFGSTAVASAKTSPTPPRAKAERCANCHSVATPLSADYMHSGESTTRFFKVTPRIVNGEKSWGVALMAGTFWSDGLAGGKYLSGGF